MNRRGLLKALGFGVAALPTMGAKEAAKMVGLDMDMQAPLASSVGDAVGTVPGPTGSWWGSPLQITLEAQREAQYREGGRYAHMKSWARHYREAAEARDCAAFQLLRHKVESDAALAEKVSRLLMGRG